MFFYFSKLLQGLIWPLNLVLFSLALSTWWLRRERKAWAPAAGFLILWIFGTPLVAGRLIGWLETYVDAQPLSAYPGADAIVVLGGSVLPMLPPRIEPEEMNGLRVFTAARLYRQKKSERVFVSGGGEYRTSDGELRTDADDMRYLLIEQGVRPAAILSEGISRNTHENARETARVLGTGKKILLVTSAFHLRRATALYRRAGFEVIPVPADHHATYSTLAIVDFFPDAESLENSTRALKEYVGHAVYSVLAPLLGRG